jgi:gas vesicle protein
MNSKKTASRVGAGLAAGAALGLALGLFLQSRKGKALTKDAQKNAKLLQKQVMKKLANVEDITKEKYEEVVDQVLGFYEKGKDVATKELPEVRSYLMGRWKEIKGYLEDQSDV